MENEKTANAGERKRRSRWEMDGEKELEKEGIKEGEKTNKRKKMKE